MTGSLKLFLPLGALLIALALTAGAGAQSADVTYEVKITNLTQGQPFTPPALAAHTNQFDAYEVGQAATNEVRQIAENGDLAPFVTLVSSANGVVAHTEGTAPVKGGETATLTITAPAGSLLSWVSMLICTNDGFTGFDSVALPASGSITVDTNAYDAGTEQNTEDFADIVPPCQALVGVTSGDAGTGASNPAITTTDVIAAHPGVQGGTDLTVAAHGWTDPVARVTITAAPGSLPSTGGPPATTDASATGFLLVVGGLMAILGAGAMIAVSRRTSR